MKSKVLVVILFLFVLISIHGCDSEKPPDTKIVSTVSETKSSAPLSKSNVNQSPSSILPDDAINHIGERGAVCGKVADSNYAVRSNGSPTFLNFNRPYPNHPFTIVIWGNKRSNFPDSPEQYYLNKDICITGLIESYKGKPQIVAVNKSQISINN